MKVSKSGGYFDIENVNWIKKRSKEVNKSFNNFLNDMMTKEREIDTFNSYQLLMEKRESLSSEREILNEKIISIENRLHEIRKQKSESLELEKEEELVKRQELEEIKRYEAKKLIETMEADKELCNNFINSINGNPELIHDNKFLDDILDKFREKKIIIGTFQLKEYYMTKKSLINK